jgi:hypothetical protein
MPSSQKPRKKTRTVKGRVDGCERNPLAALAPPSKCERQAICIAAYSNHAMMQDAPQNVSPEGVQMIIDVLDCARALANRGYCTADYTAVWDKARAGIKAVSQRYKSTGKIGYDGWAIEPVGKALDIHEMQLKTATKKVLLDVIDELLKDNQKVEK